MLKKKIISFWLSLFRPPRTHLRHSTISKNERVNIEKFTDKRNDSRKRKNGTKSSKL